MDFPNAMVQHAQRRVCFNCNEFWDLIGGEGTYKTFITEVNKLGKDYKERIYREFLEIEPPKDFDKTVLK